MLTGCSVSVTRCVRDAETLSPILSTPTIFDIKIPSQELLFPLGISFIQFFYGIDHPFIKNIIVNIAIDTTKNTTEALFARS